MSAKSSFNSAFGLPTYAKLLKEKLILEHKAIYLIHGYIKN